MPTLYITFPVKKSNIHDLAAHVVHDKKRPLNLDKELVFRHREKLIVFINKPLPVQNNLDPDFLEEVVLEVQCTDTKYQQLIDSGYLNKDTGGAISEAQAEGLSFILDADLNDIGAKAGFTINQAKEDLLNNKPLTWPFIKAENKNANLVLPRIYGLPFNLDHLLVREFNYNFLRRFKKLKGLDRESNDHDVFSQLFSPQDKHFRDYLLFALVNLFHFLNYVTHSEYSNALEQNTVMQLQKNRALLNLIRSFAFNAAHDKDYLGEYVGRIIATPWVMVLKQTSRLRDADSVDLIRDAIGKFSPDKKTWLSQTDGFNQILTSHVNLQQMLQRMIKYVLPIHEDEELPVIGNMMIAENDSESAVKKHSPSVEKKPIDKLTKAEQPLVVSQRQLTLSVVEKMYAKKKSILPIGFLSKEKLEMTNGKAIVAGLSPLDLVETYLNNLLRLQNQFKDMPCFLVAMHPNKRANQFVIFVIDNDKILYVDPLCHEYSDNYVRELFVRKLTASAAAQNFWVTYSATQIVLNELKKEMATNDVLYIVAEQIAHLIKNYSDKGMISTFQTILIEIFGTQPDMLMLNAGITFGIEVDDLFYSQSLLDLSKANSLAEYQRLMGVLRNEMNVVLPLNQDDDVNEVVKPELPATPIVKLPTEQYISGIESCLSLSIEDKRGFLNLSDLQFITLCCDLLKSRLNEKVKLAVIFHLYSINEYQEVGLFERVSASAGALDSHIGNLDSSGIDKVKQILLDEKRVIDASKEHSSDNMELSIKLEKKLFTCFESQVPRSSASAAAATASAVAAIDDEKPIIIPSTKTTIVNTPRVESAKLVLQIPPSIVKTPATMFNPAGLVEMPIPAARGWLPEQLYMRLCINVFKATAKDGSQHGDSFTHKLVKDVLEQKDLSVAQQFIFILIISLPQANLDHHNDFLHALAPKLLSLDNLSAYKVPFNEYQLFLHSSDIDKEIKEIHRELRVFARYTQSFNDDDVDIIKRIVRVLELIQIKIDPDYSNSVGHKLGN